MENLNVRPGEAWGDALGTRSFVVDWQKYSGCEDVAAKIALTLLLAGHLDTSTVEFTTATISLPGVHERPQTVSTLRQVAVSLHSRTTIGEILLQLGTTQVASDKNTKGARFLLVIRSGSDDLEEYYDSLHNAEQYAMVINCAIDSAGIHVCATVSKSVIEKTAGEHLLSQFSHILHQVTRIEENVRVGDIDLINDEESSNTEDSSERGISSASLSEAVEGSVDADMLRLQGGADEFVEKLAALADEQKPSAQPLTEMEKRLQEQWAQVLGIDASLIGANDNFLHMGGDSADAIRLVAVEKVSGLSLTVADILRQPQLSDLALAMESTINTGESATQSVTPFSLLRSDIETDWAREQAALLCSVAEDDIEDVFPCTPMQEGLLAMTAFQRGDYVARIGFDLAADLDITRLETAWAQTVESIAALRTRVVDLSGQGLVQVVLNRSSRCLGPAEVDELETHGLGLGTPLCYTSVTRHGKSGMLSFTLVMHHAIYDDWSLPMIAGAIEQAYRGVALTKTLPLQGFVRYLQGIDSTDSNQYWQAQLAGSEATQFPSLPSPAYRPRAVSVIKHHVKGLNWAAHRDFTATSIVRSAWALLQARYTTSSEAIFGTIVTGRQAPVPGIERIAGPLIATVPVRVEVDKNATVTQLLAQVQEQALQMITYEQAGLQNIRRLGDEAEQSCQFQSLIVVHPPQQERKGYQSDTVSKSSQNDFRYGSFSVGALRTICEGKVLQNPRVADKADVDVADGGERGGDNYAAFSTHALVINCEPDKGGLRIQMTYDPEVLHPPQARRVLAQLEHSLRQLLLPQAASLKTGELEIMSEADLRELWGWNATVHEPVERCVHDMIAETVKRQPDAPAVCAWDGELTYAELDQYSTQLAYQLIDCGMQPSSVVPLCFEKSMWTPVSILGVMKAGGASVLLDVNLPEERLRQIVSQVDAKVMVTSAVSEGIARRLNDSLIVLASGATLGPSGQGQQAIRQLPVVQPSDALYIVFTSGSTGVPKGIIVTHQNFCSAYLHQQGALGFRNSSRVFEFASYAFDVVWSNFLHTLYAGGCICTPSESARRSHLTQSMRDLKVNFADLTPTVARLLDPAEIPELETLLFGGEAVTAADAEQWRSIPTLINTYGPAETTIKTTITTIAPDTQGDPSVGYGVGGNTWVVDQTDRNRLAPIGCVGELVFDGPLIVQGYLNNAEKTAACFVKDPPWLLQGAPGTPGRHSRVYYTGDLVRYREDGSLDFLGRMDDQVKLRGQRIELGEIEHHVRRLLRANMTGMGETAIAEILVAAEVIKPSTTGRSILAAFVVPPRAAKMTTQELQDAVRKMTYGLNDSLVEVVPPSMIPTGYIALASVPTSASGKTDRKKLRQLGATFTMDQLTTSNRKQGPRIEPRTPMERRLRDHWAQVLSIDASAIGADDSFPPHRR